MQEKTKNVFTSQTVRAGLLIVVFSALRFAGVQFSEADSAEASEHVSSVVFGLLGLWAIWGRIRASQKLTLVGQRSEASDQKSDLKSQASSHKSTLPAITLAAMLALGGCAATCATGCAAS